MTEAEHRKLIRERQERSQIWKVIHIFGSLRLAMFLLFTIALACAIATLAESNFSTKVAQVYVYKNPLFLVWLGFLCLNLACATLTRWPWRRKHLGFVITHAGIITLLIGAVIGSLWGFEGAVNLHKGRPPAQRLASPHSILLVESPMTGLIYATRFDPEIRPPTPARPRLIELVDSSAKLRIDRYSESLVLEDELVEDPAFGFASGVAGTLESKSLNQSVGIRLLLQSKESANFDLLGLAQVEWVEEFPEPPPPRNRKKPVAGTETYRETQMIFLNQPIPVTHNTSGGSSGYQFRLVTEGAKPEPLFEIVFPGGEVRRMSLVEAMKKPIPGEQAPTEIILANYWPDLRMVDGRPVTASVEPNNPAALVTLSGLIEDTLPQTPNLLLAPGTDQGVRYQLRRGQNVLKTGSLAPGESLATGWNDWSFSLDRSFARARIRTVAREKESGTPMSGPPTPGIRGAIVQPDGQTGEPRWIASGTTETFDLGGKAARIGFGLETRQIPFGISLINFEVPRDEGTETPANFISTVRFHDERGATREDRIEMNSPASFPPEGWRQFTGTTYKFSQAGWNASNLDETTLQVLYDPGWSLKWIGSLMICAGIFIMFYLRPKTSTNSPAP
jgi:hypothetical protein